MQLSETQRKRVERERQKQEKEEVELQRLCRRRESHCKRLDKPRDLSRKKDKFNAEKRSIVLEKFFTIK